MEIKVYFVLSCYSQSNFVEDSLDLLVVPFVGSKAQEDEKYDSVENLITVVSGDYFL